MSIENIRAAPGPVLAEPVFIGSIGAVFDVRDRDQAS
jgi:hypothetical protein